MKAHRKYLELINLKLDGRLSPGEEETLNAHLAECNACREEYEAMAGIRRNLLSVADIPLDRAAAERRKGRIMAALRKRGAPRRAPLAKPGLLRPAVVLATLLLIFVMSFSVLHKGESPGPQLFSDPQDVILDRLLVNTLNEHELTSIVELFNDPALVASEIGANGNYMVDQLS